MMRALVLQPAFVTRFYPRSRKIQGYVDGPCKTFLSGRAGTARAALGVSRAHLSPRPPRRMETEASGGYLERDRSFI